MLSGGRQLSVMDEVSDNENGLTIPSILVTMDRFHGHIDDYSILFITPRIAGMVAKLQQRD